MLQDLVGYMFYITHANVPNLTGSASAACQQHNLNQMEADARDFG